MNSVHPATPAMRIRFAWVFLSILLTAAWQSAMAVGYSTEFTLSGFINSPTPLSFDLTALENYATANPSAQRSVIVGTDTWTGLSLNSFLSSYLKTDPGVPKNDVLRDYVVAKATDNYQAAFSLGEINPNFGNQPDYLAYANAPGSPLGLDGFARTVVLNDLRGGRYVSNLNVLTVADVSIPEPATALLMLGGLLGFSFGGFRRRSQESAG